MGIMWDGYNPNEEDDMYGPEAAGRMAGEVARYIRAAAIITIAAILALTIFAAVVWVGFMLGLDGRDGCAEKCAPHPSEIRGVECYCNTSLVRPEDMP